MLGWREAGWPLELVGGTSVVAPPSSTVDNQRYRAAGSAARDRWHMNGGGRHHGEHRERDDTKPFPVHVVSFTAGGR